ncbi:hypothetical protein [Cellulomonas edaphi]|uniref:Transcriptional regulator, AbiEi antitoxin, Type IV TA system n=1 Tax=Cellulomonas edaphi TaxID=3053468 RepID=A0ABT7S2U4_9CELL|nr:hypothetical protein [Cellulomons edaphi]MDM7829931.1 hypothetical protein [Cellulomons edaphi]
MPRRPGSSSGLRPPAAPPRLVLARDHRDEHLARLVADGSLTRLHRGAYLLAPAGDPQDLLLARIAAAHHLARTEHCFSHTSAALLHGLGMWRLPSDVEVYQAHAPSSRARSGVVRHTPLPPADDRAVVAGLPATTLARTAWDCMTTLPAADALVIADAALRAGVDPTAWDAYARPRARGHARARAILAVADDGAESAPESICRYRLLRAGFPPPETQIRIPTRLGTFYGDLGWSRWRVVIEYDGRIKYADRPTESLVAEKRRHDALVEEGWRPIRVTKEDLRVRGAFEARVARHLPAAVTSDLRRRGELAW